MRHPGVDELTIRQDKRRVSHIAERDLSAFNEPVVEEELLSDSTREVFLRPLNVAFVPGNKWRVHDGTRDLFVSVKDLDFLRRVETNAEKFGAGDLLRCDLRSQQWRKPNGDLRGEDTIVRVKKHLSGPREEPLPFPESDSS